MSHGIARVRNLGSGSLDSTEIHNEREYKDKNIKVPKNIDQEQSVYNQSKPGTEGISYKELVENRIKEAGVSSQKKNSVVAIEFVISASKDFFSGREDKKTGKIYPGYSDSAYLKDSVDWLEKRYGKENVVAWTMHFDESTPHLHAIIVPIAEKEVKWKNRNGEGIKTETRLAATQITGGPKLLRKLQDDFYEHVSTEYKGYAEWHRGTLVEKQQRQYTKETHQEIGLLRSEFETIKDEAEKLKFVEKIEAKKVEMEKELNRLNEMIENKHQRNKGDGWKKGSDFFHNEPLVSKSEPLVVKPEPLVVKPEPLVVKPEPLTNQNPKHDQGMGL